MQAPADALKTSTGVPDHRFAHLMGLGAVDALILTLSELAVVPVPAKIERQRAQLQDAMLDCHFTLGMLRFAIAADPDLLGGFQRTWIGYQGTRATLFDLANILLTQEKGEIRPYRSPLKQWPDNERHGNLAHAA